MTTLPDRQSNSSWLSLPMPGLSRCRPSSTEPFYYREDRQTEDLFDTRNPTPNPDLAGVPCGFNGEEW